MKSLSDFKVGDELVYLKNFLKKKTIENVNIVTRITDRGSLICDVKRTGEEFSGTWTEIPFGTKDNYILLDDCLTKYPEYMI